MAGIEIKSNALGLPELQQLFNSLRGSQVNSIFNSAFRKASKPIIKGARSNLKPRKRTGNLSKSIGVKPIRGKAGLIVGARTFGKHKGYAGHILDKGTVMRYRKTKSGKRVSTGKVNPTKYFKKAVDGNSLKIQNTISKEVEESVLRFVARANNRTKTK